MMNFYHYTNTLLKLFIAMVYDVRILRLFPVTEDIEDDSKFASSLASPPPH
jgi:hypothetical protein